MICDAGHDCLRTNNINGLPQLQDYQDTDFESDVIPHQHQAIIPSYRFDCCGNITEWGAHVQPGGGNDDMMYTLDFQVWRPSPTVESTGCYSLVGSNRFTSVPLNDRVALVTPLPQERIQFQPGDVLGFYVESAREGDRGVVVLNERRDNGYETEEVWHADISNAVIPNLNCPFPVGSSRVLNTFTNAAPVISVSYSKSTDP